MYSVALLPPSNIGHSISLTQTEFFRRCGDPFALALPPHVPLGFFDVEPPRPAEPLVQDTSLYTDGIIPSGDYLFLQVLPEDLLIRLSSLLIAKDTGHLPLYPIGVGIPMVQAQRTAGIRELPGAPPILRWKSSHVVCFEMRWQDRSVWWENFTYTETWRVKLRRKI